ncbi:MAG TPA: TetR/AcrR family transcriptional regulator, partial [Pseudonocardiaceae bacterium]|nr:TetR/AcrR family transcriptional regulator [Pseudonocardiaceae bacterium]
QLSEQISGVVEGFRRRLGQWLNERGVPAPDQTAAVLAAAIDGLLLHRGLGSGPPAGSVAPVLRRLVNQAHT